MNKRIKTATQNRIVIIIVTMIIVIIIVIIIKVANHGWYHLTFELLGLASATASDTGEAT